ncbi:MAG: asparagine synthase (glutamine-hydrolyzing) [Chitinophagaceae bacterium]
MCGIAGGINSEIDVAKAEQILARIRHRGPDDSGTFFEENLWLGNTRLAIRDLSGNGHQPMRSANGRFVIVYNGELYNQDFLRKGLGEKGVQFHSHCDTETLLQAFAYWRQDCLQKIEGDFAFAVYDTLKKEVFLARDPMGVKPLYYYQKEDKILFASELKALTDLPHVDYSLRQESLASYLLFQYCPNENTPFQYFKKLLPGHFLHIKLSEPETASPERYFSIPFTEKYEQHSLEEWTDLTDRKLEQTVLSQMESDAPIGLTLSGGLDSSLLAAYMRKAAPGKPLKAFSINTHGAMKGEGFEDDINFARLAGKDLNIELHEVSGSLSLESQLDEMVWQLDEPQADPAALHLGNIAQAAHEEGIKVLLGGTGADDIFSGYRRHQALSLMKIMSRIPSFAAHILKSTSGKFTENTFLRRAGKLALGAGLPIQDAMIQAHFWQKPETVAALFKDFGNGGKSKRWAFADFEELLKEIPDEKSLLNQMLLLEQRAFLPHHNLAYLDKMSMAHSVEMRVPYVSRGIVELAASLPPSLKMKGKTTKFLLREVAKRHLPSSIIYRKKTGFGAPLRQWMRGELRGLIRERLLDESFLNRGIFEKHSIVQLMKENERGKADNAYTLFSLLAIESWLRQFAPRL